MAIRPRYSRRSGVMLTEACIALMLVGLLLAMVSLLLTRHARATDYFLNYRRAQLAAEACIERMRTGVLQTTNATFTDEAGVAVEVDVGDAHDQWQPLKLVRVTASATGKHGRVARYCLSAYVRGTVEAEDSSS